MKKHIEVVAAVIEKDNKIFCARRADFGEAALKWEFPGGKIKLGELHQEALTREIKEELNSIIEVIDFIQTVEYEYKTFHLTMHVYKCQLIEGNLEISEHIESKWVEKDRLYEIDLAPADIVIINKLNNMLNCLDI